MKNHPIADLFPMMGPAEYADLVSSMRAHGYDATHPIITLDGLILDGRNRWKASQETGVKAMFRAVENVDPYDLVWRENAVRRDLTEGQKTALRLKFNMGSAEWREQREKAADDANRARTAGLKRGAEPPKPRRVSLDTPRETPTFVCTGCGDGFGADVWECSNCGSHVAWHETSCQDCHESTRAKRGGDTGRKPLVVDDKPAKDDRWERSDLAKQAGVSPATAARVIALAKNAPQKFEAVAAGTMSLADATREFKRESVVAKLTDVASVEAKATAGVYDVIVIDPPWAMEKIERDERPNQTEFDYPTMSEAEIAALPLPHADDCHVWVWTTHKFLPMAFRLLGTWGLKYVCTFVWHKPGGFQPIGLPQYNCEFALYARKGSPSFIDTKALPVCFEAPRGKHSEKPEAFYDVVRRVTAGRRLDMFNRRPIDGFDTWGKEAVDGAAE